MSSTATKVGHGLAKVLGIDLHYRNETGSERITRGESVFSIDSADSYVEHEPTAREWLHDVIPNGQELAEYVYSLFPFVHWITRYNLQWLIGDLVAGLCINPYLDFSADFFFRHNCRRGRCASKHGIR